MNFKTIYITIMNKLSLKNLNMSHLTEILTKLGKEKNVFHSEAQFQFELAWILQDILTTKSMPLRCA